MQLYGYAYNSTLYIITYPLNSKHIEFKGHVIIYSVYNTYIYIYIHNIYII